MDKVKRIQELVSLCNYHSNKYYIEDKPEISDKDYDKLYDELSELEKECGYILSSSPTQKVQGKVLDSLVKVQHSEPMLSAEKSKDINDVKKFMGNQECVLSWKLDGLTIVLRYNKGELQQAITRGGGTEGEDVTHTVKTFTNVPLYIDYTGYLELRGEGLVTFKEFERINSELLAKGEETYSSPRNLAAGSVRQLDANITKDRKLIFIAFGIVKCDAVFYTKAEQFEFLKSLGFNVVFHHIIDKSVVDEAIELFKGKIKELEYLTDGLIFEYNDIVYGKSQGVTGHHSKSLYALKWADDSVETKFLGVELNTTRTGMCSITGLFEEVDIDGVKVSRASLHNVDIFEALQLGVSDTVTVYRANAVIPQIEDNLTRSGTYKIDMHCPSCRNDLVIRQPKEARFLFCENENCPSKLVNKFVHYCSKNAMNIDGLSEAGIQTFLDKGWIETFADLYRLDRYKADIIKTEGFGVRSYEKLIQAIEKSKNVKLESFLVSLGVNGVGVGGAKRLAKHFKDIDFIIKARISDLMHVEDFGETTSNAVYEYFRNSDNIKILNDLLCYVAIIKEDKKFIVSIDLTGKTFVVTGEFINFKPRKKLEELIESLGGKLAGSVSKSTFALLTNDTTSGSKKNQDAQKYSVQIMDESEFMKYIEI